MVATQTSLAHDVLEGDIGRTRHGDIERTACRALGIAGRLEQDSEIGALHHLVLVAVVEHREARRHVRLERELLQQPGTERVDGLYFQSPRRFQRTYEQFTR